MTKRTAPPRRVKPAETQAEWITRLGHDGRGIALINGTPYLVEEITDLAGDEPFVAGFRVTRSDLETVYDLEWVGTGLRCDCRGHERWGHCRHATGLLRLIGEPDAAEPPAEVSEQAEPEDGYKPGHDGGLPF